MNNWPGGRDQALTSRHSNPTAGIICGTALTHHGVALYKHHLKSWRRVGLKWVALSCVVIVAAMSAIRVKPVCLAAQDTECLSPVVFGSSFSFPTHVLPTLGSANSEIQAVT